MPDRHVADGERVDVPGWDIDAVWTPGHTPGHLCFHVPAERMLLSGDHVLPSITPHISISRRDRGGDPLGDFLDSLGKVAALDATEVLPAHRHRFADLPGGSTRSPVTTSTTSSTSRRSSPTGPRRCGRWRPG